MDSYVLTAQVNLQLPFGHTVAIFVVGGFLMDALMSVQNSIALTPEYTSFFHDYFDVFILEGGSMRARFF